MIFAVETKELFTDGGELIKKLECPLRMNWDRLTVRSEGPHRSCAECERAVLNTAALSEEEVVSAVRSDPSTCLAVSARQANIQIVQRL